MAWGCPNPWPDAHSANIWMPGDAGARGRLAHIWAARAPSATVKMPTLPLLFLSLGLGLARAQQDESQVPAQPGFHPKQVGLPGTPAGAQRSTPGSPGLSWTLSPPCPVHPHHLQDPARWQLTQLHTRPGTLILPPVAAPNPSPPGSSPRDNAPSRQPWGTGRGLQDN